MFIRNKLYILLIFLTVVLLPVCLYAGPGDDGNFQGPSDDLYQVTVSKIEISGDGSTWVTLGEGTETFNIASLTAGTDFSNYITNTSIPAGVYTHIRITLSREMLIKGSGEDSGSTYYTTSTTTTVGGGELGVASPADDDTNYDTCTIIIPDDAESPSDNETLEVSGSNLISTIELDESFTVPATGGTLEISFGTQNVIEFDDDDLTGHPTYDGRVAFWPIPPRISIEFE